MINVELLQSKKNKAKSKKAKVYRATAAEWIKGLLLSIEHGYLAKRRRFLDEQELVRIDGLEDLYGRTHTQAEFMRWVNVMKQKQVPVHLTFTRKQSSLEKKKAHASFRNLIRS